jgi:hypothetical protein
MVFGATRPMLANYLTSFGGYQTAVWDGKGRAALRFLFHILPISWFAFRHPLDCSVESFISCFLSLCFGDPIDILFLVAVVELIKRGLCFLVLLQSSC